MTRDSDPLTTPSGEPVFKRNDRLRGTYYLKVDSQKERVPLKKPRSRNSHENRKPRILDAYEAMQARAAGRLYDDDDVSPFTSEDDE